MKTKKNHKIFRKNVSWAALINISALIRFIELAVEIEKKMEMNLKMAHSDSKLKRNRISNSYMAHIIMLFKCIARRLYSMAKLLTTIEIVEYWMAMHKIPMHKQTKKKFTHFV